MINLEYFWELAIIFTRILSGILGENFLKALHVKHPKLEIFLTFLSSTRFITFNLSPSKSFESFVDENILGS